MAVNKNKERAEALAKFIEENCTITPIGEVGLYVDGISCKSTVRKVLDVITYDELDELLPKVVNTICNIAFTLLLKSHAKVEITLKGSRLILDEDCDLVLDVKSSELFLVGKEYAPLGIPATTIQKIIGRAAFDKRAMVAEQVQVEYNPYSLNRVIKPDGDGVLGKFPVINTYVPEPWRYKTLTNTKLPTILDEHFTTFAPDAASRHYLYCWLRTALLDRCGTYLLLLGQKGTGKGLLEMLLERAFGETNFGRAQRSFFSKEFNSILRKRQLIVLDEIKMDTVDAKEKAKSYINEKVTLEAKGIEANESERIFASFIVTNNSKLLVRLDHDDRRFSPIDITNVPMLQSMGRSFTERLAKEIKENDQMVEDFCSFLFNYDVKNYNTFEPFKGDTFKEVVILSLNIWQQQIYELLVSRKADYYVYDDLFPRNSKNPMMKRPRSGQLVSEFLSGYTWNNKSIGKLGVIDDELCIIPCEELMPEDRNFEEL